MAIVVVAQTRILAATGTSASGSVSATAGNSLICGVAMYNTASCSVTRTGDTWTLDANGNVASAGSAINSAPNVAGGSVSATVTCASADGIAAWFAECSGMPTSGIRDVTSPAANSGTSTSASTGSATNVTADAIYFGVVSSDTGSAAGFTVGGSYTDTVGGTPMTQLTPANAMCGGFAYLIVSSAASRNATWTISPSADWTAELAVYQSAAGGAVITLPLLPPLTQVRLVR